MAWLPRSLFRCVGWRVQVPGWWPSACCDWVYGVLVPFWLVGLRCPTPIHSPGLRAQHDVADVRAKFLQGCPPSVIESGFARFVLPKGVRTVSTLMSAIWSPSCDGRHGPSVALLEPVSQHSQGQPFLRVLVSRQLLKQPNPLQHRRPGAGCSAPFRRPGAE